MASLDGEESRRPEAEEQHEPMGRNIINNYYGKVNHVERAENCNFGLNNGTLIQNSVASMRPGSSSEAQGPERPRQEPRTSQPLKLSESQHDLFALLNPILDASHTRNRQVSPPNSACLPGTRQSIVKVVRSWVNSSLMFNDNPHILWIYGYAGCGKSAIAQEVAEYFASKGQLAASFFFFRGSGDRSSVARFATTIASQVASGISVTAPGIKAAVIKNPGLLTTATATLSAQFQHLVYEPIAAITWERMSASLRGRPYLIILDGLDECEDRNEVAAFIEYMIAFFARKPRTPLRFLITSRVESHIHQQLHSSNQVRLLDLVDHTSDSDIAAALDAAFEKEKHSRILSCAKDWPSVEDKARLVEHIGGSYIFMTTLIRLLFDSNLKDGLTPMTRLPLLLCQRPDFDSLYKAVLEPSSHLPHFHDIVSTIALALEPLSISQIAELLEIDTPDVVDVLLNLHSIMQIPGDDHRPITLWHISLRDFLCSPGRSETLHAPTAHHRRLAYRCITLCAPESSFWSSLTGYSLRFAMRHWVEFMETTKEGLESFKAELSTFIALLQSSFPNKYHNVLFACFKRPPHAPSVTTLYKAVNEVGNWEALRPLVKANIDISHLFPNGRTELEIASRARNWKVVRGLVEAMTNMNAFFHGTEDGIVTALHSACYHQELEIVDYLLEHGADPNTIMPMIANPRTDGSNYGTPLALAARKQDVKLVTRLLECGADPNLQVSITSRRHLGTALRAACTQGSLEIVNLLLDHGADPNLRGGAFNRSALHECASSGHQSCARALLMRNGDPNVQDDDGETTLHRACYWGHINVTKCLLEFKADASIRNNRGQTALQYAQENGRGYAVRVLRRYGIAE